jgi:hypothetical protein
MAVIFRIRHAARGDYSKAGDMPAPQVIRDQLDDMRSPIDGKPQTSKRAYYKQIRAAGCEIHDKATVKDSNRPEYDTSGLKQEVVRAFKDHS